MRHVVLDTNALIQALPTRSRYHKIWTDFLANIVFRSKEVIGSPVKNMTAVTMTTGRLTPSDALIIKS